MYRLPNSQSIPDDLYDNGNSDNNKKEKVVAKKKRWTKWEKQLAHELTNARTLVDTMCPNHLLKP